MATKKTSVRTVRQVESAQAGATKKITAKRNAASAAVSDSKLKKMATSKPAAPAKKAPAKKAAAKKYAAPAASGTTMRSTFGSKMEGPVSQRIRGAEWAYRKAGHAANLRKKARTKAGASARKTIASDKKAGAKVGKYSAK